MMITDRPMQIQDRELLSAIVDRFTRLGLTHFSFILRITVQAGFPIHPLQLTGSRIQTILSDRGEQDSSSSGANAARRSLQARPETQP